MTIQTLLCMLMLTSLLFDNVNATPCYTFEEWIARPGTTSVECVTPTPTGFTIPDDFATTLVNLENLVLNHLGIQGSISSLTSLIFLTNLDLGSNLWTGPLPNFAALSRLTSLNLSDNLSFNAGAIPNMFASLSELTLLDLGNTSRTSTLPTSMETLSKLKKLILETNQLIGTISPGVAALPALMDFTARTNLLTGQIPAALIRSQLDILHLSSNRFSGSLNSLPFSSSTRYFELSVTYNRWYGVMPEFTTFFDDSADINIGDSLGNFIPDGDSCSGRTSECSSGVSKCGTNEVCCKALYTAPNMPGECSGACEVGTGVCVTSASSNTPSTSMPTKTPNTEPSTVPSKAPTRANAPSTTMEPNTELTMAPTSPQTSSNVITKAPSAPQESESGSTLLIPVLSATGVALILGFFIGRHIFKRNKVAEVSKDVFPGESGSNWSPNPKYGEDMGEGLSKGPSSIGVFSIPSNGTRVSTPSNATFGSPYDTQSWASKTSGSVSSSSRGSLNSSFRGHVNGVVSVSSIDV